MMRVYLIRHSYTAGNLKKRYIGRTDEPLCEEGVELLKNRSYPQAERIYISPMLRCRQSAELIYPGKMFYEVEELRECDFGLFENKNYLELSDCAEYQEWIDSQGRLPFPKGESREKFCERTLRGFQKAIDACRRDQIQSVAFVVHGGSIMNIMECYARPAGSYYDYQIRNGEGYELFITDDDSGRGGNFAGSSVGGSTMALSSGADHWTSDYMDRKNYQKLFSEE